MKAFFEEPRTGALAIIDAEVTADDDELQIELELPNYPFLIRFNLEEFIEAISEE